MGLRQKCSLQLLETSSDAINFLSPHTLSHDEYSVLCPLERFLDENCTTFVANDLQHCRKKKGGNVVDTLYLLELYSPNDAVLLQVRFSASFGTARYRYCTLKIRTL